ncbi:YdgA family protein [Morganella morganii]|uniref:YdgA family protein n=1 Tax=Morganella morganii TaxID=582 RepID=UPI001BD4E35A|nr:YdgA family protein [Morganella morganii]BEP21186.1 YdgA family protein [Morganella morganii subsp. sibonii]EKK5375036.1 YdgA family protein [Morganella morganii]EKK5570778.1 YdgA family protein [Morganella morganii]EKW7744107.1 YdgA family protein [Morganella morganii]ELB1543963.1 YdgA family protein [Morganella morganii]
MKKSLVAVGVIVALGAAWGVASWQTGKKIEANLDAYIAKANQLIKDKYPDIPVTLTAKDFSRGIFSSDVKLILKETKKSGDTSGAGEEVVLLNTIDHGPFPLSQLKSMVFSPNMAAIHTELENNDVTKPAFDITGGKSPVVTDTRVSYDQSFDIDLAVSKINYKKDGEELAFSGADLNVKFDKEFKNVKGKGSSDELTYRKGERESMVLKGLSFDSDVSKSGDSYFYLGDQNLSLKELAVVNYSDTVSLKDLKMNGTSGSKDNKLTADVDYSLGSLSYRDIDLGAISLKGSLKDLDATSANTLMASLEEYTKMSESMYTEDFDEEKMAALDEKMKSNALGLFKYSPSFAIAPLSWKNSGGESKVNLNVTFNALNADSFKALEKASSFEKALPVLVKEFGFNMDLSKSMLTDFVGVAMQSQGMGAKEAKEQGEQGVAQMASMGAMMEIVKVTDKAITMDLKYSNNNIDFNGKKYTVAEFLEKYDQYGALSDNSGDDEGYEEEAIEIDPNGDVTEEVTIGEEPAADAAAAPAAQ